MQLFSCFYCNPFQKKSKDKMEMLSENCKQKKIPLLLGVRKGIVLFIL
ncbi:hypothetical protein HMPREF9388_1267 [Streptococcus sanguinis SK353]|uniref:Uncharacterized protein n=1 Tax=Streptococcus sanguinis SK353 TaxID=888815 RepID=F0FEE9_STRSA|nr:hypothetical protein HMPREF9388_1267 [Streptococcus sanguinis SK353]